MMNDNKERWLGNNKIKQKIPHMNISNYIYKIINKPINRQLTK